MNQTKKYEQDFTQGALSKQILLFSIPLMFTNVLQILFNMADIAVVGRFAGTVALGAVGSTATLVSLFTGLLIGIARPARSSLDCDLVTYEFTKRSFFLCFASVFRQVFKMLFSLWRICLYRWASIASAPPTFLPTLPLPMQTAWCMM